MTRKAELQIVTANHLLGGHSVFLTDDGWTSNHRDSRIALNRDEAAALEALGKAGEKANEVVGVYLVDVALDSDGNPEPVHYREKMRVRARPSFWPDEKRRSSSLPLRASQEGPMHVSL